MPDRLDGDEPLPGFVNSPYEKMWGLLRYKVKPGGPWPNTTVFELMRELEQLYLLNSEKE